MSKHFRNSKKFQILFSSNFARIGTSGCVQANSSQVKFQREENNSNNNNISNNNINNNNILETKERKSWRKKTTGKCVMSISRYSNFLVVNCYVFEITKFQNAQAFWKTWKYWHVKISEILKEAFVEGFVNTIRQKNSPTNQ